MTAAGRTIVVKRKSGGRREETEKLWLMFPKKLVRKPVIWELGRKFPVVTNIRSASVHDDIAIVSLELSGRRADLDRSMAWLEKLGVKVQPVELGVIES